MAVYEEELHATLPSVPSGWRRRSILHADGVHENGMPRMSRPAIAAWCISCSQYSLAVSIFPFGFPPCVCLLIQTLDTAATESRLRRCCFSCRWEIDGFNLHKWREKIMSIKFYLIKISVTLKPFFFCILHTRPRSRVRLLYRMVKSNFLLSV